MKSIRLTFTSLYAGLMIPIAMIAMTSCDDILGQWDKPAIVAPPSTPSDPTKPAPTYTAPVFSALTYTGVAQELVTAGSSEQGTIYYSTSENGTYTTAIPQGTDAGDYTVWYKVTGDANHSDIAPIEITGVNIGKADFATVSIATVSSKTYTGSAITPTPEVTLGGNSIAEGAKTFTYSYDANTNVGTSAKVILTPAASGNFSGTAREVTFTICASAATVTTAPAAVAGTLTYDGTAQNLVTAGVANGGTMKYFVNNTGTAPTSDAAGWTDAISTGTSADTYYIWYYVAGDANHGSTDVTAIAGNTKAIAQKALTITANAQTIAYGSSIATGTSLVTPNGLVTGDALTAITLTPSTTNVTTTGTITPSAAETTNGIDNYTVTYNTGNLTITAVAASVTTAPAAVTTALTYNNTAQALVTAGTATGGTLKYFVNSTGTAPTTATDGWTTTVPTGTNANTYYIWYYVAGDGNHNNTAVTAISGNSKAIGKAAGSVTLSASSQSFAESDAASSTKTFTITGNTSGGALSVQSSNNSAVTASIIGTTVTLNRASYTNFPSVTITVTSAETDNYNAATQACTVSLTATLAYVTTANVGNYVCTDGSIYLPATNINKTTAGMIAYVSSTGHGLIIAKSDAGSGEAQDWVWMDSQCTNYTPIITVGSSPLTWKMPSQSDWQNMGVNDGNDTLSDKLSVLNTQGRGFSPFNSTSGTKYWSSTAGTSTKYITYSFNTNSWGETGKYSQCRSRACAEF